VECCFSKLKQFRRVATRFEKTARNYRAVVTLAASQKFRLVLKTRTWPALGQSPDGRPMRLFRRKADVDRAEACLIAVAGLKRAQKL
jgi:hypothetical protein